MSSSLKTCLSLLTLLACLCLPGASRAETKLFEVSGKVTGRKTGRALAGVEVKASPGDGKVVTDGSGAWSLSLPAGTYKITFSKPGQRKVEKKIVVRKAVTLNLRMALAVLMLGRMVVVGQKKDRTVTSTDIGVERFTIQDLAQVPVFMGEKDIMKTIQLTPGITTIAEGRSAFIVRGSGIDQNMILMDGMPIYYTSHMSGLYSVFNSDAVERLVVYKGGVPARYGGRSASILSVRMRGDEVKDLQARLGLGLITSKASLAIPIVKGKLSVFLAGRSSYLSIGMIHDSGKDDGAIRGSTGVPTKGTTTPAVPFYFYGTDEHWYDINAKIVWKPNSKHALYLTGFYGRDQGILIGMSWWGNRAAALQWKAQLAPKLLSDLTAYYSEYYTDNINSIYVFHSGIITAGLRHGFNWFPAKGLTVTTGYSLEYQDFDHGTLKDTKENYGKFMPPMQSLEGAVHLGAEYKILPGLTAYLGLRYSFFFRLGSGKRHVYDPVTNESVSSEEFGAGEVMKGYHLPEPRFSLTYLLNDQSSVKATYNRNAQYLRLMTNSMQLTWYDIWMPSTSNIPPMTTDQWAVGYFLSLHKKTYRLSIETYYKHSRHAADFEDGLHNYLVDNLEAYVATGDGRSYGLELMIRKKKGPITGWISYNVGRSEQKITGINRDQWYPSKFDKTHDMSLLISVELMHFISKLIGPAPEGDSLSRHKLYLTALFLFQTGNAVTLPEGQYYISGIPFPYWDGRNRYRLPDYHRLDLGLKYQFRIWRTLKTSVELSIYNVYNRRNVNSIGYSVNADNSKTGTKADPSKPLYNPFGISYYGFRPSATLTVEY